MESRNYTELERMVDSLYSIYKTEALREKVTIENNKIKALPLHSESIRYSIGADWEHEIKIIIPGKKTFQVRGNKLSQTIQRNDIKIIVTEANASISMLSHENIIRDLYRKVNGDYRAYEDYRWLLKEVYLDNNLNETNDIDIIYQWSVDGYKIPTLVSFLRWCGAQENINYHNRWGKDLNFARYFEAIYAGYKKSNEFLESVCKRANVKGEPPWLYESVNIEGASIDLYNGCLDMRKTDRDGDQRTIKLCEKCYEYEAVEENKLCENCEIEETEKLLAEEESGTKQYEQKQIEEMFGNCLYDIRTTLEIEIEENFQQYNLKPIYNYIDNNFNGTMFKIEINNTIIEIKVEYGCIVDDPSDNSYVILRTYVNQEEINDRYVEFINGEYEWNSNQSSYTPITDAKFKFDETDIEEFVSLIIEEIESTL